MTDIEGLDDLRKDLNKMAKRVEVEVNKALLASGMRVENDAKMSIAQGGKSGRAYNIRGKTHVASAPGEAPASLTGRLLNSFHVEAVRHKLEVIVSAGNETTVDYAYYLEHGTRNILPRPFMKPALKKNQNWIHGRIQKAVDKAVR